MARVKTRILIISDTHGAGVAPHNNDGATTEDELAMEDTTRVPTGFREPLPKVDVVLHCGDLTKRSRPAEFQQTFAMLRAIDAPLKLVIAGNHDMALHEDFWKIGFQYIRGATLEDAEDARKIINEARSDGVRYLEEGTYTFDLDNGARLKVYASQWTPSFGSWAFQYDDGHDFDIPADVDVAMTHGPPKGVLDFAGIDAMAAGCDHLFGSVYRAKPRIHCFGHIHEAWGAYLARWKTSEEGVDSRQVPHDYPRVATVIDEANSRYVKQLKGMWRFNVIDGKSGKTQSHEELVKMSKQRGALVDLTEGDNRAEEGKQTLFVNAAIMNIRYHPLQCPWIVDVDLPVATSSGVRSD